MSTALSSYFFQCVAAFGQYSPDFLGMHGPPVKLYSELNLGKKYCSLGAFYFQNFQEDYPKKKKPTEESCSTC